MRRGQSDLVTGHLVKRWVLAWENQKTGRTGRYSHRMTQTDASRVAAELTRDIPTHRYWAEEVKP